ncbi:MAG: hypothetical protein ACKOCT_10180, partial [Alphaproteobacteria bacterium]
MAVCSGSPGRRRGCIRPLDPPGANGSERGEHDAGGDQQSSAGRNHVVKSCRTRATSTSASTAASWPRVVRAAGSLTAVAAMSARRAAPVAQFPTPSAMSPR